MNAAEKAHVQAVVQRAKLCLIGKIKTDMDARLPAKPEPLSDWDKYKSIREGKAVLKRFTVACIMTKYHGDRPLLVDGFTYPVRKEVVQYEEALNALEKERVDRELAVETAFTRLADERILGLIDALTFLDQVEKMQQASW